MLLYSPAFLESVVLGNVLGPKGFGSFYASVVAGAAGSEPREGFVRASEGKQRNVMGALEITGALRERRSWLYRFFLGRSGSLLGSGGNW